MPGPKVVNQQWVKIYGLRTFTNRVGHSDDPIHGWFPIQTTDEVRQIIQNRKIVLDSDDVAIWIKQRTDNFRSFQSLLDIQVTRRLVEHIPRLYQNERWRRIIR